MDFPESIQQLFEQIEMAPEDRDPFIKYFFDTNIRRIEQFANTTDSRSLASDPDPDGPPLDREES